MLPQETRGVKTKVETDGRVFPITDNSQSVIDCLRTEAKNLGVSEHLRTRVTDLKQINNQWELEINQSEKIIADRVCLALGSLRGTGMEKTLTALGHIISPLIPSLFAFNLPEHPMVELAGISVPHALAKTLPNGKPVRACEPFMSLRELRVRVDGALEEVARGGEASGVEL